METLATPTKTVSLALGLGPGLGADDGRKEEGTVVAVGGADGLA